MADTQTPLQDQNDTGTVGEATSGSASTWAGRSPGPVGQPDRSVPEAVTQRYLRLGERYFNADHTLAFIDTGMRLKVRTDDPEVVPSLVAIMQARGWRSVRLTGTQAFRQGVWREATRQGIDVQGYEPSELERLQTQRVGVGVGVGVGTDHDRDASAHDARRQPSGIASGFASGSAPRRPDPAPEQPSADRPSPPAPARPSLVGLLLDQGPAPYRFDPQQGMSYHVRVRTEAGERTLWGHDLERALVESRSGARVGDTVVVRQRAVPPEVSRSPETFGTSEREGSAGAPQFVARRVLWSVETTRYVEALERKAALFRRADVTPEALLTQHPELASAAAALKLGEQFARRLAPEPADQARMVQAIRTRLADAIAQGQDIGLPQERPRPAHIQPRGRAAPGRDAPTREDPVRTRG